MNCRTLLLAFVALATFTLVLVDQTQGQEQTATTKPTNWGAALLISPVGPSEFDCNCHAAYQVLCKPLRSLKNNIGIDNIRQLFPEYARLRLTREYYQLKHRVYLRIGFTGDIYVEGICSRYEHSSYLVKRMEPLMVDHEWLVHNRVDGIARTVQLLDYILGELADNVNVIYRFTNDEGVSTNELRVLEYYVLMFHHFGRILEDMYPIGNETMSAVSPKDQCHPELWPILMHEHMQQIFFSTLD